MVEIKNTISAVKKLSGIILENREEINKNSFCISNHYIATSTLITVKHRNSLTSKIS